jgi:uncharacterized protein YjfI (DUF2170 family)
VATTVADTAANVVTTGATMIDKAFYTDQEKAENNNKLVEMWLKLQSLIANDTGISAVARRGVAYIIMGTFCFLILFACVIWRFDAKWAEFILKTVVDTDLAYLALTVGFFFYGFYSYGKYVNRGVAAK